MDMDRIAGRLLALSALGAALCAAAPARADLRMCNNTSNRVSVAIGYTDGQNWVSEGWWNLKSLDCVTLLRGALAAEYYYLYAMDERGGDGTALAFSLNRRRSPLRSFFAALEKRTDVAAQGFAWSVNCTVQLFESLPVSTSKNPVRL